MLKLENVTKRRSYFLLESINFLLPAGYIMGLIGENGAGKTTLLHILSGLYSPDGGRLWLDEKEYGEQESSIKQECGLVLHEEMFDANQTLLSNANHYGSFYSKYQEERLIDYAVRFQLDLRKKYKQLSKGEKLKFAMAFALSYQPRMLLLDEPTANFDREFRQVFFDILREYTASGKNSVILSTHLMSEIDRVADYVLFLKAGKQQLFGDIETIRGDYRMVAGEAYKIQLLKNKVIHMESGEYGSKALIYHSGRPMDPMLKVWEPSMEEIMYYMVKGGS
ncbi:MAG: ABC transporter ATP-binding protein [Lachnospiraceae bacterium]|nr:ABC transporter ATP-binding protein [Lachnospiraceae bacterium]